MGNSNGKEMQELMRSMQAEHSEAQQKAQDQLRQAEAQRQQAETRLKQLELQQAEAQLKQAEIQRQQAEAQRQQAEAQARQAEAQRQEAEAQLKQVEARRVEAQQREEAAAETAKVMRGVKQRLYNYPVNVAVTGLQASGKTSFVCSAIQAFQADILFPTVGAPGSRTTRHIVHFPLADNFTLIDLPGINARDGLAGYMRAVQDGAVEQNLVVGEALIPARQLTLIAPVPGVKFQWIIVLDGLKLFDHDPNEKGFVSSDRVYGPYLKSIYEHLENQHDVLTVVLTKKDKLRERNVTYNTAFEAAASMLRGLAKDRFFWIDLKDPKNVESVRTTSEVFNCIVGRRIIQ